MEKLTFTIREAAEVLNIGISKTYELVRQNILPNIKVGKRIIIPKTALDHWLQNCKAR